MSFADEMDAELSARETSGLENAHQSAETSDAARPLAAEAFDNEIRELWHMAEEYWRANKMVDAASAWWVEHGDMRYDLTGEAPLPFPKVGVFLPGRLHTSWKSAASTAIEQLAGQQPTKHLPGLAINDWFAICAPGELRELLPISRPSGYDVVEDVQFRRARELKATLFEALRWNYYQTGGVARTAEVGRDPSWIVGFEGPGDLPDVQLVSAPEQPIEVYIDDAGQWSSVGTLRSLMVSALADQMAK